MISEYGEWLRSQTNRHGRPFQQETISAYRDAAVALSSWMTSAGLEADFTGCDTAALNRFFRGYLASHSQGGTNTKQRNLRHLFTWLAAEYGHAHPYTDGLVRYAPVKVRPSTLAADFIKDLLSATGGGRARTFEDARDHAMIRVLTEGVRRAELVQIRLDDLPADLIARHGLTFPVGFGADARAVAGLTGAFVNPDAVYLQSTGFVLDPEGKVVVSVYSSGAIGRLVPEDVAGLVRYARQHAAAPAANPDD